MKVRDHNTCNDENESLRQQLAAALAACSMKDAAIKDLLEFATYSTCGKAHAVEAAKEALTIQPDDSALKYELRFK